MWRVSGWTGVEARPPASIVEIGIMLEQFRSKHEEIANLEQLIIEDLKTEETCPMRQLLQGHRLQSMANSIILKSKKLVETYEKIVSIKDVAAQISSSISVSSAFSLCLAELLEYHRKHPCAPLLDNEAVLKEDPVIAFTGEECFGRYLDLHDLHNQYINSSFGERVDYSAYLDVFSQPEKISPELKMSSQYTEYMEALLGYLIDFFQRTRPLHDLNGKLSKVEADLEEQYGDGKVKGLAIHGQENELIPSQHAVTDRVYVEELIDLEPENLTEALAALGLNTGGTQQKRAARLFLTKHARLDRKQLLMEAKVKKLCSLLDETIARTKQNRGKNEALALEELEGEQGHTESESGDGYKSALKRSTGWDGMPIPYWLDKVGLGQEYKCALCRGYPCPGKRAFERHISERLHQGRLKAGWNLGPLGTCSQSTGTEGNSSNEAPAGVAVPPPEIRIVLEEAAGIISKTRLEIERKITDTYSKVAGFEFLKSSDEYHPFYKIRLATYRARASDGAGAAKRDYVQVSEFKRAPPAPRKFTCGGVPEGITGRELDIIKLAAQFWALYGGTRFWKACSERKNKDPQFEFMMKPGDGRFDLFGRLVIEYLEVVSYSYSKRKLRKNLTADMETVLENCFNHLQWDRYSYEAMVEEERAMEEEERARERDRSRTSLISLVVQAHLCRMAHIAFDPPPKPDLKRPKIDESDLVPEDLFLAQNRQGCAK
ncbi:unnamed protein product [Microthlaspi erraticum]|uniref:SURP motif domain-containing protein n=1 Tax=Microthlaspi erraticum TaxID=1685480 RepID=A0A6D2JAJ0_9BRAS|nr:unnamed protein product [Microthlaspi erraticum]